MAPIPPEPPGPYPNETNIWEPAESLLPPTATIKELYPAVMNERPDSLRTAAEGWKALATQLQNTKTDLGNDRTKLAPQWTSIAAVTFFGWVTNSEESLEDWKTAANQNVTTLNTLAGAMEDAKRDMKKLWDEFERAAQNAKNEVAEGGWDGFWNGVGRGVTGADPINETLKTYTERAVNEVMNPMANAYSTARTALSSGHVFTGPTDAAKPTEEQLKQAFGAPTPTGTGPGRPGGGPAAVGSGPNNVQGTPPTPPADPRKTPTEPTPPPNDKNVVAPQKPQSTDPTGNATRPEQPNQVIGPPPTPPAPPGERPGSPPAAPGLAGGGGVVVPPVAPVLPGNLGRLGPTGGGGGTTAPPTAVRPREASVGAKGLGGGGGPTTPGLQGRTGPQVPNGMPPGSRIPPPQLPGRGGTGPTPPGVPGGGGGGGGQPGAPALPGRNGGPGPRIPGSAGGQPGLPGGGAPPPPNRTGAPPSLQGIRNGAPQRPTTVGFGPGGPRPPGGQLLDGRFGPAAAGSPETLESARGALRSGLDGRGLAGPVTPVQPGQAAVPPQRGLAAPGGAGTTPPQGGRPQQGWRERPKNGSLGHSRSAEWVGDEELFAVDEVANAVIERPEERGPVRRPGPAIGVGGKA